MKRFARVWIEGERRSVILRVTGSGPVFLHGYEVNRDGDEVAGRGFDDRLRVISRDMVRAFQWMAFSKVYGWLVADGRRTVGAPAVDAVTETTGGDHGEA